MDTVTKLYNKYGNEMFLCAKSQGLISAENWPIQRKIVQDIAIAELYESIGGMAVFFDPEVLDMTRKQGFKGLLKHG